MANKRGNNEGSIYKREDGTWRAQVTVDGKRLSFSASSYQDCREWIKSTLQQIDTGLTFDKAQITFGEFLQNWLASAKVSLRPKTWQHYHQISGDYILPSLGRIKLVDLRADLIQSLYDKKVTAGVGLRTIQLTHAVIRRCLNRAVKLGVIGVNPATAAIPPKPSLQEMKILDENQVQTLLITAKASEDRLAALYQLAITTGMRQGELLGLKWSDIEWDKRIIRIQRQLGRIPGGGLGFGTPKTNSGIRNIILGPATINLLKEHQKHQFAEMRVMGDKWQDHDLIFPSTMGTPTHPRSLLRRFKKLLKDSGLSEIRFHDLRHTAASLMLNHGIPVLIVSKRIGHAKPSITLDVYGHLIPSMQEQAAEVMDEIVTPIQLDGIAPVAPGLHRKIY